MISVVSSFIGFILDAPRNGVQLLAGLCGNSPLIPKMLSLVHGLSAHRVGAANAEKLKWSDVAKFSSPR